MCIRDRFTFDCKKYEQLYAFMTHDKKNTSGTINFTLLKDIGDIRITVSYTHLDVYKRQGKYSGLMVGSIDTPNNGAGNWE